MADVLDPPSTVTPEQALEVLKSNGYVVRTAQEDESYLTTHVEEKAKTLAEEKIGERWRAKNEEFEAEIKTLTGIEKKPGENAQAYLKRAIPELKSKDVTRIEQDYAAQLEAVKGQLTTKEAEIQQIRQAQVVSVVKSDIDNAVAARIVAYPAHITTDEQKAQYAEWQKKSVSDGVMGKYTSEIVDGKVVYSLGNEVQRNKQDGKALTAAEIVDRDYGLVFAPKQTVASGTGSGAPSGTSTEFATESEAISYLKAKGMKVGSKEYMAALDELTKSIKK